MSRRLRRIEFTLAEIRRALRDLAAEVHANTRTTYRTGALIMDDLDELTADVNAQTDVINGASTLLDTLADKLDDVADDPDQVRALAQQVRANTSALADAVARNTPADPAGGGDVEPTPGDGSVDVPPEPTPEEPVDETESPA